MIERPLDMLNQLRGKKAKIEIKGRKDEVEGTLLAFDIHINLVLEVKGTPKFYRGDCIVSISPGEKE